MRRSRMPGWETLVTHWVRICVLLLFLIPFLVSCSVFQIGYAKADWILLWRLDRYFDLTVAQEEYLGEELEKIHVWHRQHELPKYVQFLSRIQQFSKDGLSHAELDQILATVETFRIHVAKKMALPGARFASTLSSEQIEHFQHVLEKDNRRLADELGHELQERLETRTESTLKKVRSWVGGLSEDQEFSLRDWMKVFPDVTQEWLDHRKHKQAILIGLLKASDDAETLEPDMLFWLASSKNGATEEYLNALQIWWEGVKMVLLKLDATLTPAQRDYFSEELQELIQELDNIG